MDKKTIREIAVASAMYGLGSILGPLFVIGSIGWILDKVFNTGRLFLFSSIFVAFIVTNFLLFKKLKKINKMIDAYNQEETQQNNQEETLKNTDKN